MTDKTAPTDPGAADLATDFGDGSISDAVSHMPDFSDDPASKAIAPRDPAGKFTKTEGAEPADKVDAKTEDDAVEDEADDEIELPPEAEGKEPTRLKLSEVLAGYRKAQTLEAEVTKLKASPQSAALPADYEQQVIETVKQRQNYAQGLAQVLAFTRPQAPNPELTNPQSAAYNPEAYYQQVQSYNRAVQMQAAIKQELDDLSAKDKEQQEALSKSHQARERAKLLEAWPEVKEKAVVEKVYADLAKHYGIDKDTVDQTVDSRFYLLARDALAHRAAQAKSANAAKVVMAKPKLIKGSARSTINGKQRATADAIGRLSKSGSLEDAAEAIGGLLG